MNRNKHYEKKGNPERIAQIPQIRDLRFTNNTGFRLSLPMQLNSAQVKELSKSG
ncbi:Uncharacterised protein [Neisseria weaveri]|uniref:Uncharacterized protein n=1 Tax=Neisseria weaveri TaxID=28091 RepID=A0A3S4Z8A4_9NEIS|nr:hypothetical protein l13_06600 [Neisseria weaveri ATCC 51223]SAY51535.1 Uncharacterised protein [Neisseria weaveri]VEJ50673.1 Uncharacterised protein [Neisseria weaveri]